jgi:hypothetical protein
MANTPGSVPALSPWWRHTAILELTGLSAFAANILGAFLFEPSHVQKQPLVVATLHAIA